MTQKTKVLIIGAGPAGYTAAIYAARANLQPLQILGPQPGGQLMVTTDVENYPGFAETIQGPWLMEQMRLQAEKVGTEFVEDWVTDLDLSSYPFHAKTERGLVVEAQSIIFATGAQARWLGLPSEEKFRGFGVSGCATCDGFFYKNKKVVVVGGGNTAVEEALYLTHHASEVVLVHRRDSLRAEKVLQDRLLAHPKVSVLWNRAIDEVVGDEQPFLSVTGLKLKNTQTGAIEQIDCHGVFIAIGHDPATSLLKGKLDLDPEGYVIARPGSTATSIPGFFAAGDVQDKIFRQAITAAGQGCMAALEVEKFLSGV